MVEFDNFCKILDHLGIKHFNLSDGRHYIKDSKLYDLYGLIEPRWNNIDITEDLRRIHIYMTLKNSVEESFVLTVSLIGIS